MMSFGSTSIDNDGSSVLDADCTFVLRANQMSEPNESASAVEKHEYVLGTPVKWSWLEEKLCAALHTTARFGEHRSAKQTGIGKGFLSVIGRIHPEWTLPNEHLPNTVIIKIATLRTLNGVLDSNDKDERVKDFIEVAKEENMINDDLMRMVHNNEVAMYTLIANNRLNLKVPKTYVLQVFDGQGTDGIIVMEDMGESSITGSTFDIITVDQIHEIIDELVELHKFSYGNSEWMQEISTFDVGTIMEKHNYSKMLKSSLMSLTYLDDALLPLINRILEEKSLFDAKLFRQLPEMFGIPPVATHGDLWVSNVMWKVNNGQKTLAGVLDWQGSHPGSAAEDISRFISCAMTAKDRREHWKDILKYYYEKLGEKMQKDPPFSYEQLERSFIRVTPCTLIYISSVFGPLVSKEADGNVELMAIVREKAIGVIEDILYFHSLSNTSEQ